MKKASLTQNQIKLLESTDKDPVTMVKKSVILEYLKSDILYKYDMYINGDRKKATEIKQLDLLYQAVQHSTVTYFKHSRNRKTLNNIGYICESLLKKVNNDTSENRNLDYKSLVINTPYITKRVIKDIYILVIKVNNIGVYKISASDRDKIPEKRLTFKELEPVVRLHKTFTNQIFKKCTLADTADSAIIKYL